MGGPHTPEALKAARREAGKVVDTVCFDKGWGFRDALIEAIAPLILLKDAALAALQQVTAERDEARNPFGNFTPTVERIALLMGRVWLEAKGAAGDTVADFEEFAMLAPEDCADCCTVAKAVLAAVDPAKANERAEAAEASLATATSELARLRAEGEAKDRALKLLLPFVDYAAGEGLMFVETEDGEHPEMDAADIMGFAAQALGLELGSDAYLALLPAGYDAIRAARAATAREGA